MDNLASLGCPGASALSQAIAHGLSESELLPHIADCPACSHDIAAHMRKQSPAHEHKIGRYVVLGELGRGSTSVVVEAFDPELERVVAIKIRSTKRANDGHETEPVPLESATRLLDEARAMASLEHEHVVRIYDAWQDGDEFYIVMQRVIGEPLSEAAAGDKHAMSVEALSDVLLQTADGLAALHEAGRLHRDVTPANILISDGKAYLADLGLARPGTQRDAAALPRVSIREYSVTHEFAGTPMYSAPELLAGGAADERSDQYALALCLFEALTGELPGRASTSIDQLRDTRLTRPERGLLTSRGVPSTVADVLVRALEPEPTLRFSSVAIFAAAIRDARGGSGKRRIVIASAVLAAAAVTMLAIGQFHGSDSSAYESCEQAARSYASRWAQQRGALQSQLEANAGTKSQWSPVRKHVSELVSKGRDLYRESCRERFIEGTTPKTGHWANLACLGQVEDSIHRYLTAQLALPVAELTAGMTATIASVSLAPCIEGSYRVSLASVDSDDARAQLQRYFLTLERVDQAVKQGHADEARRLISAFAGTQPHPAQTAALDLVLQPADPSYAEKRARVITDTADTSIDPYTRAIGWAWLTAIFHAQNRMEAYQLAIVQFERSVEAAGYPSILHGFLKMQQGLPLLQDKARMAEGRRLVYESLELHEAAGDWQSAAEARLMLTRVALSENDIPGAQALLQPIATGHADWIGVNTRIYLDVLNLQHALAMMRRDSDQALEIAKRRVSVAQLYPGQPLELFRARVDLGESQQGAAGLAMFEQALSMTGVTGPERTVAEITYAEALQRAGRDDEALRLLESKLDIVRGGRVQGYAAAFNTLGKLYRKQGKHRKAFAMFREGIAYARKWRAVAVYVGLSQYLGAYLVFQGEPRQARGVLAQLLEQPCGDRVGCAVMWATWAVIEAEQGRTGSAKRALGQARELSAKHCPKADSTENCRTIARLTKMAANAKK